MKVVQPRSLPRHSLSHNSRFRKYNSPLALRLKLSIVLALSLLQYQLSCRHSFMWKHAWAQRHQAWWRVSSPLHHILFYLFMVVLMTASTPWMESRLKSTTLMLRVAWFFLVLFCPSPQSHLNTDGYISVDAIYYTSTTYKPHTLVDLATLTGYVPQPYIYLLVWFINIIALSFSAAVIALGEVYSAVYSVRSLYSYLHTLTRTLTKIT